MKEQIKGKIGEVMNAFVEQELGNKVTQFNIQGLVMVLMSEIDKVEVEEPAKKKSK